MTLQLITVVLALAFGALLALAVGWVVYVCWVSDRGTWTGD